MKVKFPIGSFNKSKPSAAPTEARSTDFRLRPKVDAAEQDLMKLGRETVESLLRSNSPLFVADGRLVRVENVEDFPTVQVLNDRTMHRLLADHIHFFKFDRAGEKVPARPPKDLAAYLLASLDPTFRRLRQLVSVPILPPTGGLILTPGYHPASCTLYIPSLKLAKIPEDPTEAELRHALGILKEALQDFPFVSESDRAHAIAALIEPFVRFAISAPVPIYIIEKPSPGTGGTLLALVLAYPFLGQMLAGTTPPADEAEFRRTILTLLCSKPPVIFFDNVDKRLDSPALASAITTDWLVDRLVRTSELARVQVGCSWLATGNNIGMSKEIARRSIRIRLDARVEHPDLRSGFRHPQSQEVATSEST